MIRQDYSHKGFVYLMGAGPGDPGLITVKAVEILKKADIVIYDNLANQIFVKDLKCDKIYVGKKSSDHTLSQDNINKLIIDEAKKGKIVVRLKGGDPFVFGRGGEEAETLINENIGFEIIPGISSFYSVPAYAGIPITHRDYANCFEVITGHRRKENLKDDISYPEYNSQKTYVFLMGVSNLKNIVNCLMEKKNFPTDLPVAIISNGTTADQKTVTASLENIFNEVEKNMIKAPAIIIMGQVVNLHDRLQWFSKKRLFGKKIVVTRTREQASKLTKELAKYGAHITEVPVIKIVEYDDQTELENAINNIEHYEWIIFTSQNAVKIFFKIIYKLGFDARFLSSVKIAVIGEATANELIQYGIKADIVPKNYVAESLLDEFTEIKINKKILLPCSKQARLTIKEGFESRNVDVDRVHIYEIDKPEISDDVFSSVKNADFVTFTSASTVNNFYEHFKKTNAICAAIGPITAGAIKSKQKEPEIIAEKYTIEGLVDAILNYCN